MLLSFPEGIGQISTYFLFNYLFKSLRVVRQSTLVSPCIRWSAMLGGPGGGPVVAPICELIHVLG